MTNEEVLEVLKAQIDTSVAAGLSSPQDAQEFIDLTRDQTQVLREIRVKTGIVKSFNLDTLYLNEPVVVAGIEGAEPDAGDVVAAGRARATLQPKEILAAFDVTYDWLRKNILNRIGGITREEAQARAMQALNDLFAKRFGKDVVMIAFSGDTSISGTTRTDKALKVLDGFVKQAEADAEVHDYTIPASPNYNTVVFPGMLELVPKDYLDELQDLAFFVAPEVYLKYAFEMGQRATAIGDQIVMGDGQRKLYYHGVELVPVYKLATGRIVLTLKQNLAVGFGKEITVETERKPRARKIEATFLAELDAKYALGTRLCWEPVHRRYAFLNSLRVVFSWLDPREPEDQGCTTVG